MKYETTVLLVLVSIATSLAQETEVNSGYDSMSIKNIHESDIMWSKGLTRRMDLREKPNESLFAKGHEFTKLILEAVEDSLITPYKNAALSEKITQNDFMKSIELPDFTDEEEDPGECCGDIEELDNGNVVGKAPEYFFPTDLYLLEIDEVVLFDKQRSRMYTDIRSITLFLSADHPDNYRGIDIPLATFSYKELHDNLFKDNANAIWFNPYNNSEHLNLADAFELRLFQSYIVKETNPKDEYLIDIYGGDPKSGRIASQQKAYEILEFESNLWEN